MLAICLLTVALIMNFIKNRNLPMNPIGISQKVYPSLFGISVYDGIFGPGQATMLIVYLFKKWYHLPSIPSLY
nr:hypothetical protein [Peribacillus simplex]